MSGCTTTIAANHGHTVAVSTADVAAMADKTFTLVGAPHTHDITITAADFGMLDQGMSIMVTSTSAGTPAHTHVVTVSC
jgi:hypothetical protein